MAIRQDLYFPLLIRNDTDALQDDYHLGGASRLGRQKPGDRMLSSSGSGVSPSLDAGTGGHFE